MQVVNIKSKDLHTLVETKHDEILLIPMLKVSIATDLAR